MKNHWLDRKKVRETPPFSTLISTSFVDPNAAFLISVPVIPELKITIPPITINWGTPPVISCIVTIGSPTCQKEINESQINEGCFGEISVPSIISFQPIEGWAGANVITDTCGILGTLPVCITGGYEGGNAGQVAVC